MLLGGIMTTFTILIVDDNKITTELLFSIFSSYKNFHVITSNSGAECLTILRETEVDLLLLDIMMPEVTGFDVLEEIYLNNPESHMHVLVMSAQNNENLVKKAFALGASDYLMKPLSLIEIVNRVKHYATNFVQEENITRKESTRCHALSTLTQ